MAVLSEQEITVYPVLSAFYQHQHMAVGEVGKNYSLTAPRKLVDVSQSLFLSLCELSAAAEAIFHDCFFLSTSLTSLLFVLFSYDGSCK